MLYLSTLAIVNFVSAMVLAFATVAVRRFLPQEQSLRFWTVGSALLAGAALFLGLRGIVPDFLSVAVANTGLVLGTGFIYVGSRKLFTPADVRPWHWLASAAAFLFCVNFTFFNPSVSARIAAVSLLMAPFCAASGWTFWRHREGPLKLVNQLTALIFLVGAVIFLLRGATTLTHVVATDYRATESWIVAAPYFYSILFNVWMSIMLALKLSSRLQAQLGHALAEAKTVNRDLAEALEFNKTILLESPLPMGVYAETGQCVLVNEAYAKLVGLSSETLLTQNFNAIESWKTSGLLADCLGTLAQQSVTPREMHVAGSSGTDITVECRILLTHLNGQPHLLIQFLDLTDRLHLEQTLRKMAFHDVLTELPNRRLFADRLGQALSRSKRDDTHLAILFLDLNRFKDLNDSHGHEIGDKMLIEVAERLRRCVRDMDTVARFGGDEFVVLFEGLSVSLDQATESVGRVAEKIQSTVNGEYQLGSVSHEGSASIGVKLCHGKNNSSEQIIHDADMAMYEAKKAVRGAGAGLRVY